jgi:hypothetical protein
MSAGNAATCACSSEDCRRYGCKTFRDRQWPYHDPNRVYPPTVMLPLPVKGCICPPTAEQTCLRKDCGRK